MLILILLVSCVSWDQSWRRLHHAAALQTIVLSRELNRLGIEFVVFVILNRYLLFVLIHNYPFPIQKPGKTGKQQRHRPFKYCFNCLDSLVFAFENIMLLNQYCRSIDGRLEK